MKKVFYHEIDLGNNRFEFEVITDEAKAKELGLPLATVDDLEWIVAACGEVVEGVIQIADGIYQWIEKVVDDFGGIDIEQGYEPIN